MMKEFSCVSQQMRRLVMPILREVINRAGKGIHLRCKGNRPDIVSYLYDKE